MIEIARRFAAYIPVTLVRQIMEDGLPEPGQPRPLWAATLFSDISGFTSMSEELASDGSRGAEELNRVLLTTFTAMIDLIHEMGGAVSHFYGDAMSVYFPETEFGDAAQRALACGQSMQKLMSTSFSRAVTNRPPGKDPIFPLTIKIGVGYGRCQEIVVGDAVENLEFVLTGTAVDEAASAEKIAQSGELVASAQVLNRAGLSCIDAAQKFCVLTESVGSPPPRPILDWSVYDETALSYLMAAAGAFIPNAIVQRLAQGGSGEIAEHRPVTSLFVDFDFVGDKDDTSDVITAVQGRQLHDYYRRTARIVARFGGDNARINRILTGDKGNQFHIIFGAPVAPDAPEQAVRCAMTLLREKPDFIAVQRIGLAAGKVFAGPVGSSTRREYTVVGDVVNLSARLAQICQENCVYTNSVTASRVDNWIEFEVLPPAPLKGKQTAVSPYRPIGERSRVTQLQVYFSHWERPLVGRETELDLLLGGMDAALRQIGGVAAILGAVGVGKTHLLAEGIRYWLEAGGAGLVGVAQQHEGDVPYGPWLAIWRDFFNLRLDMSPSPG
jgi:class 3 adenylate cyclase